MDAESWDIVTGGAGFIGSHLVEALVEQRRSVVVVDNLEQGRLANLAHVAPDVTVLKVDVRDTSWWPRLAGRHIGRVFHLAANASVPRSSEDPGLDLTTNVLGTLNMLRLAAESRARFLFTSSAAVYGVPDYTPTDEQHPTRPVSPYGASKLAGEGYVRMFHRTYGVDTRIVRYFNCYGPRQPRYILHDFLAKARSDAPDFEVLGSGAQVRCQLHVEDAVRATLQVAERGGPEPINVGSDVSFDVLSLAQRVLVATGRTDKRVVTTGVSWPGDIPTLIPDLTRLRALGFRPSISLDDGLSAMVAAGPTA